jgi:hypothetical protein
MTTYEFKNNPSNFGVLANTNTAILSLLGANLKLQIRLGVDRPHPQPQKFLKLERCLTGSKFKLKMYCNY